MLKSFEVKDYALIEHISVEFGNGLNIITGETGAGKSILIDAMGLLLGERASSEVVRKDAQKSVVEGIFNVRGNKKVKSLLEENEIDFFDELIIRREVSLKGSNRCFINDTPVNLDILKRISKNIIDVHSQDQTNNINFTEYQMELLDLYSESQPELTAYTKVFNAYDELKLKLNTRKQKAQKDKDEYDFIRYQFEELEKANLAEGEIKLLEEEKELLSKQEDIKNSLEAGSFSISEQENSMLDQLFSLQQRFKPLNTVSSWLNDIDRRITEIYNELKDLG